MLNVTYIYPIFRTASEGGLFTAKFFIIIVVIVGFINITRSVIKCGTDKLKLNEICGLKEIINCINSVDINNINKCKQNNSYLIKKRILEIIYLSIKTEIIPFIT